MNPESAINPEAIATAEALAQVEALKTLLALAKGGDDKAIAALQVATEQNL